MTYYFSGYSSHAITPRELAQVMRLLHADFDVDFESWLVNARDIKVEVRLASEDIPFMSEGSVAQVTEVLGAAPTARVSLGFGLGTDGEKGMQLVRAICIALAERWPMVLDQSNGVVERVERPRSRRRS